MNVLRLSALWLLSLALAGGALFCFFFGARCLVEALTYPLPFRARLSALILTATFFAAAGLMGVGVIWALGKIF